MAFCQECPVCKIVNKGEMADTSYLPEEEDHEELLPLELLQAGENLREGSNPDWTTPCVQYLTHGTRWESDLTEPEKKLI